MSEEKQNPTENNPFDKFAEHQRKAAEEAGKALESLLPPEFKEHGRIAVEEFMEGFRVLFNAAVDEIKKEVNNHAKSEEDGAAGGRKIKVDLN
jgi:hypothetical protein